MSRTLAYCIEVTLCSVDIPLQYANLVALLVQLKHACFLPFHRFQELFFFMFAHLIGGTDAIVDVPRLASQPVSKRGQFRLCPLSLRVVSAQIDAAFLKLWLQGEQCPISGC